MVVLVRIKGRSMRGDRGGGVVQDLGVRGLVPAAAGLSRTALRARMNCSVATPVSTIDFIVVTPLAAHRERTPNLDVSDLRLDL
jgi:hypothetical protein